MIDKRRQTALIFLPTPSARRATYSLARGRLEANISTHALREEGDRGRIHRRRRGGISTHALREEGDRHKPECVQNGGLFLPTPSARRATLPPLVNHLFGLISTHALREEGDSMCAYRRFGVTSISTHALREEGD